MVISKKDKFLNLELKMAFFSLFIIIFYLILLVFSVHFYFILFFNIFYLFLIRNKV